MQSIERKSDALFTIAQQDRMAELMAKWRDARDGKVEMPSHELDELHSLVETELQGAAKRTERLFSAST